MTRKVLERTSQNADPGARLAYFALPPPNGVLGVPRADLVDVDETGVWMMVCRRRYGHVESGKNAATHAPYNRVRRAYLERSDSKFLEHPRIQLVSPTARFAKT